MEMIGFIELFYVNVIKFVINFDEVVDFMNYYQVLVICIYE